jgi:hypothetical protein
MEASLFCCIWMTILQIPVVLIPCSHINYQVIIRVTVSNHAFLSLTNVTSRSPPIFQRSLWFVHSMSYKTVTSWGVLVYQNFIYWFV